MKKTIGWILLILGTSDIIQWLLVGWGWTNLFGDNLLTMYGWVILIFIGVYLIRKANENESAKLIPTNNNIIDISNQNPKVSSQLSNKLVPNPQQVNDNSISDELTKLFDLHKAGAITLDEYENLKSKVVDESKN